MPPKPCLTGDVTYLRIRQPLFSRLGSRECDVTIETVFQVTATPTSKVALT
jgi:hypothetical protein